jgi:hypothetical protein
VTGATWRRGNRVGSSPYTTARGRRRPGACTAFWNPCAQRGSIQRRTPFYAWRIRGGRSAGRKWIRG